MDEHKIRVEHSITEDPRVDEVEALRLGRAILRFGFQLDTNPRRIMEVLEELDAWGVSKGAPSSWEQPGFLPGAMFLGALMVAHRERGADYAKARKARARQVLDAYRRAHSGWSGEQRFEDVFVGDEEGGTG